MSPHEAAALAAQWAVWGRQVTYTGAGLNGGFVQAIKSEQPAEPFQGLDGRARRISFAVKADSLPGKPAKGDRIKEADDQQWKVNDLAYLGDVEEWSFVMERDS